MVAFMLSLASVSARADTIGCATGGVVGGGIGYALGNAISSKAAAGLAVIGMIGGCDTGSRVEDRTYGQPRAQINTAPSGNYGIEGGSYESPVVRAARIRGQWNAYRREEQRQAIAAYCEADPEGCKSVSSGSYPYGGRLFGPGGSVLRTPY
jgi:hypothetical protein